MPRRICLLGVIAATVAGSARADTRWWATTGFGTDGVANVSNVDAVAAAPDGTIVVAGGGEKNVSLDRYSADGRTIGFGTGAKPRSLATGIDCRPGLAVRSDGTILVACGEVVAALRPSGALRSLTSIAGAAFDSVAFDELGRTVAAGNVLLRLQADGSIDSSFAQTTLPSHASGVLVDGGRTLVVAGGSIRGYDDYGMLDTSFGSGGVASFAGFTATAVDAYSHWIVAGGFRGDQGAVVRFFAGGALDTSFGAGGIAVWGPDVYEREEVVALGVRASGAMDVAVDAVAKADVYNSYEHPEAWLVQRITGTGALWGSVDGPENYIDPTEECLQEFPVALAEQADGKTLVTGIACRDAFDYTPYYLLERYDRYLAPDIGEALHPKIVGAPIVRARFVSARVALNGPCRLIARIQVLDGNQPIGAWHSATRLDVAHGPVLLRLRLKRDELLPHVRYAVVVSAYDARGYFTNARAPLTRS
jgi:hypothetical protein